MDIRQKYQEGKEKAIQLMRAGNLTAYLEKLKELQAYKMQMLALGSAN